MKVALNVALTVTALVMALGCEARHLPTAPDPVFDPRFPDSPAVAQPPSTGSTAFLWVMVVRSGGVCIAGASIQVVRGQREGTSVVQDTPCDAWGYSGGVMFTDLTPGVEMTLRATAPGYEAEEKTVSPTSGPQQALLFHPSPIFAE
jgi:hypothetical protein